MAFSGLGAAIGAGCATWLGASRQDVMISALLTAVVFVFGLAYKKK